MSTLIDLAVSNLLPTSTSVSTATSAYQTYETQLPPSGPNIPNLAYNPRASQPYNPTASQSQDPNALPDGHGFAHLAHLPMFSLYGASDEHARVQRQQKRDAQFNRLVPEPDRKDKALMTGLKLATGVNIDSKRKMDNSLVKLGIASSDYTLKADGRKIRITRWAVNPSSPTCSWFVDIVEIRSSSGKGANMNYAKTSGKDITFVFCGKTFSKSKAGKVGRKKWCFEEIESVSFVGKDKAVVPMEVVARMERYSTPVEGTAIGFRFRDEWFVPFVDVSGSNGRK
jgi:hypothetical protein